MHKYSYTHTPTPTEVTPNSLSLVASHTYRNFIASQEFHSQSGEIKLVTDAVEDEGQTCNIRERRLCFSVSSSL